MVQLSSHWFRKCALTGRIRKLIYPRPALILAFINSSYLRWREACAKFYFGSDMKSFQNNRTLYRPPYLYLYLSALYAPLSFVDAIV